MKLNLVAAPVEVVWPPCLSTIRGKRYAISGNVWIEVPMSTVFDDLPKYMVCKAREAPVTAPAQSWKVQGSKGNEYTVKLSRAFGLVLVPATRSVESVGILRLRSVKFKAGDLVTWRNGLAQPPGIILKVSTERRAYLICFPHKSVTQWCPEEFLNQLTTSLQENP